MGNGDLAFWNSHVFVPSDHKPGAVLCPFPVPEFCTHARMHAHTHTHTRHMPVSTLTGLEPDFAPRDCAFLEFNSPLELVCVCVRLRLLSFVLLAGFHEFAARAS
jgi:hypothetical protein